MTVMKGAMKKWLFGACFCLIGAAQATQVDYVTVTTFGVGVDKSDAIQDALISALEQVNGQVMSAAERSSVELISKSDDRTATVAVGDKQIAAVSSAKSEQATEAFSQDVETKTKGLIKTWRPLSFEPTKSGDIEVTAEVTVAVLKKSKQMERTKIAVLSRSANQGSDDQRVASQLAEEITRLLVASRKFAVLDRDHEAELARELERLEQGLDIEDMLRVSSGAAPDLIAIVTPSLKNAGKGRIELSARFEVIDYTTRQVIYASSRSTRLREDDSEAKAGMRIRNLADGLYSKLIEKIAQPRVIGIYGDQLTIGQGEDFFRIGEEIEIYLAEGNLSDFYTGESIGANLRKVADGAIVFTNPNISTATLSADSTEISEEAVAARAVMVRKKQASPPDLKSIQKKHDALMDQI